MITKRFFALQYYKKSVTFANKYSKNQPVGGINLS